MALDPPSTLPRGKWMARPFTLSAGSVLKHQLKRASSIVLMKPAGAAMKGCRSLPPAWIRHTETRGSAVSRLASTHPADPAPTMT